MDQSLWQTLSTFDLIHSSHLWIRTVLSCGKYSTTMQIRIVSGFWFCQRYGRVKINIRENLLHFRKSHVRANKLDVQETDFIFTQLYWSWKNFSRCRFTHGWNSSSWSLGFGYRSVPFFSNQSINTKDRNNFDLNNVDCVPSDAKFSRFGAMLYIFWGWRSRDQNDYQRPKYNTETCIQNPQSCSWLIVWRN